MLIDEKHSIFYEKYKPQRVQDLVLPQALKEKLQKFIDNEDIPNMGLFSANPGTGKSSTANAIIKDLDCEALWINGSLDNGIDVLRGKLTNFASTVSFDDKKKVVVIDEFDYFTPQGMAAFRGFIDDFSGNCRFIFTGNYPEKIIQPLLDRLQVYDFNNFNKKDMVKPIFDRLKFILDHEKIEYKDEDLVPVINTFYPSIRSMVGALQKHSVNNKFSATIAELDGLDVFDKLTLSIKSGNYENILDIVNELKTPSNFFTFLYKNINKYYTPKQYPQVTLTLGHYQHLSTTVRDVHLNLSACCAQLMQIKG
jgi:replication factor C small subunit